MAWEKYDRYVEVDGKTIDRKENLKYLQNKYVEGGESGDTGLQDWALAQSKKYGLRGLNIMEGSFVENKRPQQSSSNTTDVVETVTKVATQYNPTSKDSTTMKEVVEVLKPDISKDEIKQGFDNLKNGLVEIVEQLIPKKTDKVQVDENAITGEKVYIEKDSIDMNLIGTVATGVGILFILKKIMD